ncbi:GGDEF domain-containing protein [Altererythrobacter arenosus]|uniref:diguanylate cyclase n=1 Tax=Altererythrobacter arenosus TaxID=3032592 RepID=A0ABY8FUL4_9SPHN|nr:diguanylate cyclase [Altererythrobacter sp. CAU 1644]WFL78442.1 GGDEF domain-containing protein [Altererythrobacter sp. CAU 1644]
MTGRGYTIAAAAYAALVFLAALALAYNPVAREGAIAPACIANQSASLTSEALAGPGAHWDCTSTSGSVSEIAALVRFDLAEARQLPIVMRTRIGLFDRLELSVVDADGTVRQSIFERDDVKLISNDPMFLADLPEVSETSRAVFMQIKGARHDPTVLRALLFPQDPTLSHGHLLALLGIAVLLGLVIAPVIFDLAFYGALKSEFLLWHAALSLSFALLVLFRSGLVVEFLPLTIEVWRGLLIMGLGLCAFVGAMFTCSFVENDKLDPRLRKWLPRMGVWALIASAIHASAFDFLAPLGGSFHSYALAPVLITFMLAMVDAYRRGSRAIRFQILGWAPLMLAFALQLLTYITPLGLPTDALPMFYLGTLSETTITAIGVADRFFLMRRERDEALIEAIELERLSVRDPLTGLLNRRAIDERFEELHIGGYETFALVDLDHFKKVNDNEGHTTGDRVLQVVARTLNDDAGTIAMRLGGEEFLLMMRGADAEERAERLRQIVSLRVARELPELSQVVTASMGLLVAPRRALPKAAFSDIYSRADMLLYEAKAQGRNRMVSEKLRPFSPRNKNDRRGDAKVA